MKFLKSQLIFRYFLNQLKTLIVFKETVGDIEKDQAIKERLWDIYFTIEFKTLLKKFSHTDILEGIQLLKNGKINNFPICNAIIYSEEIEEFNKVILIINKNNYSQIMNSFLKL